MHTSTHASEQMGSWSPTNSWVETHTHPGVKTHLQLTFQMFRKNCMYLHIKTETHKSNEARPKHVLNLSIWELIILFFSFSINLKLYQNLKIQSSTSEEQKTHPKKSTDSWIKLKLVINDCFLLSCFLFCLQRHENSLQNHTSQCLTSSRLKNML